MGEIRAGVGVAVLPVAGRSRRARRRSEYLSTALKAAMLERGIGPEDREQVAQILREADRQFDEKLG